ncbi:hypothetical protein TTHERM_00094050 (macronuclear) [Tetrahymena thermophila SB210]|uniref:Uncharacterized protein n=1 Tax=Tetrahymena thermophila (strain SB210) TaxID=312017 RepID=Q235Y6_TETTS|nr:hypothetical protein TTHERM_00094050 [Tetrahymena thermophila SB210]EAR92614.2 hypothetical protein TTHERM_00094050 [Tetrahymena thermophila SB210]|eukprot:XP_001012859.2 hypothetical protein TTHERM_00094050 [Tetrahymena thermophila SB210]
MELNKPYDEIFRSCKLDNSDCRYKQFKELQKDWIKYCMCDWVKDHYQCKMNTNQCHEEMEKLAKLRLSYSLQFYKNLDEAHLKEVIGILRSFDHHKNK